MPERKQQGDPGRGERNRSTGREQGDQSQQGQPRREESLEPREHGMGSNEEDESLRRSERETDL